MMKVSDILGFAIVKALGCQALEVADASQDRQDSRNGAAVAVRVFRRLLLSGESLLEGGEDLRAFWEYIDHRGRTHASILAMTYIDGGNRKRRRFVKATRGIADHGGAMGHAGKIKLAPQRRAGDSVVSSSGEVYHRGGGGATTGVSVRKGHD
jgi:hypothetical protein